jgi:cob(I)alamin adenosyltransferase
MKVYTKTGDNGTTSLIGGTRVPKYDERIEAYGTVDELICYIGLIRDSDISENDKTFLISVQDRLMTCASILATDCENCKKIPKLFQVDILMLETRIDQMEKQLIPLTSFVLPGGHYISSYCQIARCICRRAERISVKLSDKIIVEPLVIQYLNRLSDYLFVLSRKILIDFDAKEIRWSPTY